jgi:hypothetical protein
MSDVAALLSRIERLEQQAAAHALTVRYAKALDEVNLEALADLFTEDAVLDIPDHTYTGREAVMGFFREALTADQKLERRHFITNHEYDDAGLRTYFFYTFRGPSTSLIGWGQYVDQIVTDAGITRFRAKSIVVDLQSDVREGWATP